MDGSKLDKWQKSFEAEVKSLHLKYDAFFLSKRLEGVYQLKIETTQTFYG